MCPRATTVQTTAAGDRKCPRVGRQEQRPKERLAKRLGHYFYPRQACGYVFLVSHRAQAAGVWKCLLSLIKQPLKPKQVLRPVPTVFSCLHLDKVLVHYNIF